MKTVYYFAVAAAMVALTASAQSVHKIDKTKTQVMVARNAEGFKHCGIRFIFAESTSQRTDLYDMQMVAIAEDVAGGMITGSRSSMSNDELLELKGKPPIKPSPSPEHFWIAKSTDVKPLVPLKILPDKEGLGMLFALTHFDPTVLQILNMAEGSAMQVMLQYPNGPERVVELIAPLARGDMETLKACLKDLTKRGVTLQNQRNKPAGK
jgi:hypothetical protein